MMKSTFWWTAYWRVCLLFIALIEIFFVALIVLGCVWLALQSGLSIRMIAGVCAVSGVYHFLHIASARRLERSQLSQASSQIPELSDLLEEVEFLSRVRFRVRTLREGAYDVPYDLYSLRVTMLDSELFVPESIWKRMIRAERSVMLWHAVTATRKMQLFTYYRYLCSIALSVALPAVIIARINALGFERRLGLELMAIVVAAIAVITARALTRLVQTKFVMLLTDCEMMRDDDHCEDLLTAMRRLWQLQRGSFEYRALEERAGPLSLTRATWTSAAIRLERLRDYLADRT